MELLLILIYVSICRYVIFKLFRYRSTSGRATAALGGIIGISLILLIMNYNHPFGKQRADLFFGHRRAAAVGEGRVIEVPVQTNTPLKEGDVLFRIDPKPYEYIVRQKQARWRKPSRTSSR